MNYGLERLRELPLSTRLIREIHAKLLSGTRGGDRTPGEFRRSQNWIGPPGCTLHTASFIPPPVHEMEQSLANLETFLHDTAPLPILIHCALAHAQFETIHPFIDGNGRVGRLLITFLLCQRQVLQRPLLYLSHYFKARRAEYDDRLTATRAAGDWEGWIKFFLRGVFEVSQAATATARDILHLREQLRQSVENTRLLDYLFEQPIVSVGTVQKFLNCSFAKANKSVDQFVARGVLQEITGNRRNRRYRYDPYLALFDSSDFTARSVGDPDESRGVTDAGE